MTASPPDNEAIFHAAREIPDPEPRRAYVREACGADEARIAHLEALLAAADGPDSLLDRPAAGKPMETIDQPATESPGTVIGPYKLIEQIGEGGMGSVWMAQQIEPVKRRVAVKLIKAGMDSRQVIARFEAERQALALMDHPNIARVLDGGTTSAGRPYFVMDLVKGVTITRYCDEHHLTPRQRLELFIPVCQAVQHAHQKGIIHRDLKPSNVLVALYDGKPVPKIIDFGVAKATGQQLTDKTLVTGFGAIVGTLEYMSPEQAGFSGDDVDTRADIYSLGVMLYELLTGLRPINARRLEKAALAEMIRIIREEEPSRPSTRLSTDDSLPSLAAVRRTEPRRLTAMLRGELDCVVMKCLEKARERRYESASGLARDIQRYLADEPVEARPPSAAYRLAKLLKRHRTAAIAVSLVLLTLLVGSVGTTFGLVRAEVQRKKAEKAQAAEAEQRARAEDQLEKAVAAERQTGIERDKAVAAEAKARAINDFLTQDLLYQTAPEFNAVGSNVTLREVLDRAAARVGPRFASQPGIEMALRITMRTYLGLGSLDQAEAAWRSMLESARRRNPDAAETFIAQGELAHALRERGRRDAEVLKMAEAAAQAVERKLGPNNIDTENMLTYLAVMYEDLGRFDEAVTLFERVRDTRGARMGLDHIIMLQPLQNLGQAYLLAGKLPEAIALLKQVYEAEVKLGPDHSLTITTANNLAVALSNAGKAAEAVALLEPVRDTATAMLGPDHPITLNTLNNLATNYDEVGRVRDAIAMLERARDAAIAKLGPDHPLTLTIRYNLARAYQADGKLREAIELLTRVLDGRIAKLGPDHPDTLNTRLSLAVAYYFANQLDRSVPLFEDALKRTEARFGRAHVETRRVVANLGVNYRAAGRLAEAIPLLEEAYNSGLPELRFVAVALFAAYKQAGRSTDAAKTFGELTAQVREKAPKESPQLADLLASFSLELLELKAFAEAESLLRECLAIREKNQPDRWNTFNSKSMLGGALLGQKKYVEAEPLLLAGYQGMKQREATIPPEGKPRLTQAVERLVQFYEATNNPGEASRWRKGLDPSKPPEKPSQKP